MKAYIYDEFSKEYQKSVECQLDPLASAAEQKEVYLLPACATFAEPLPEKDGFFVCFDEVSGSWKYIKKHEPTEEEIKQARINELKQKLKESDYAIIKIAEGSATYEQYAELIEQRKAWRAEINELEG